MIEFATRAGERDRLPVSEAAHDVTGDLAASVAGQVLGADYGGDGYTTLAQADALVEGLGLRPGLRLLDVGAGRGWPGLYLATVSGCQAILVDLPAGSLRTAATRARRDGVGGRCGVVAADGRHLPVPTGGVDAVVHTDVLCCVRAKLAVLGECRRVLRRHGRMAFYTILVAPGLSVCGRRRAARCGPPAVATRSDYHRLLRSAGFTHVVETDVTALYLDTARRWLAVQQHHAATLQPTVTLAHRRAAIAAIRAGLLRRSLFTARRGRGSHQGRAEAPAARPTSHTATIHTAAMGRESS